MVEDCERIGDVDRNDDDDDDVPQLSLNALAALQEFLQERQTQEELEMEEEDETNNDEEKQQQQQQLRHVSEDWQLSQFWYTESTATALAKEALAAAGPTGRIACVSCPTLYKAIVDVSLKDPPSEAEVTASSSPSSAPPSSLSRAIVLEYDRRFSKWGRDFVYYDYKDPSIPDLPIDWRNSFDVVVCDPPFLNEECAAATWKGAVETLGKRGGGGSSSSSAAGEFKSTAPSKACKVMFCTGEIMEETLIALSEGTLKKSATFVPEHASKLSNPFVLMTDYVTMTL